VNMKVLVLDLTHGGDIIAMEYLKRGCSVTAVDIYRTSAATASGLGGYGVRCLDSSPEEDFDLAVIPVHAPERFLGKARASRTITHHGAVGELAWFDVPTVEVTGVRGKTGTVQVLSHLLRGEYKKVLSLSSSGLWMLGNEDILLQEKVSITPATLLRLSTDHHDHDVGVFEISLGGTGLGQVSVITGLQDDYPIAAGTKRALHGKAQMAISARGGLVVPKGEEGIWAPLAVNCRSLITFGPEGDVETVVRPGALGGTANLTVRNGEDETDVALSGGYLASAYALPFSCALAAAKALGLDPLRMAGRLSSFLGAPGRGEVHADDQGILVRERNPGVSAASLDFVLDAMVKEHDCCDIGLVLDPVNRKVCEKLDLDRIAEVMDRHPQITGRYMLPSGRDLARAHGFTVIRDVQEVRPLHPTVLWATKEGYL